MTPEHESVLSQALKSRKQDSRIPFLINIHDGRLIPNVPNIAVNPDYRPFRGKPDATIEERMNFINSIVATRRVINSAADDAETEPVDIGKMDKAELIAYAFEEYGLALEPTMHLATMRKTVMAVVNEGGGKKTAPVDDISG